MRTEDKEVDGRELEIVDRKSELEKTDEEAIPEIVVEDRDKRQRSELMSAMQQILEHRHIVIDSLRLPKRELRALEALKAAVDGRDPQLSQFVFASDRAHLLEQALAVLQPSIADLPGGFHDLIQRVGHLRHDLKGLTDSQDELIDGHKHVVEKTETETSDKPEGDTSLDGPERPKVAKPTTLVGPELAPEPAKPTTLTGPETKDPPKPASTLTGPELAAEPVAASSLGDATELAAIAKKPWWKRAFGG